MTRPSAAIRRQVVERARGCCESCLVHQDFVASTHQVDHVTAEKHGGETTIDNLALSCTLCNRRKGSGRPSDSSSRSNPPNLPIQDSESWVVPSLVPLIYSQMEDYLIERVRTDSSVGEMKTKFVNMGSFRKWVGLLIPLVSIYLWIDFRY